MLGHSGGGGEHKQAGAVGKQKKTDDNLYFIFYIILKFDQLLGSDTVSSQSVRVKSLGGRRGRRGWTHSPPSLQVVISILMVIVMVLMVMVMMVILMVMVMERMTMKMVVTLHLVCR